MYNVLSYIFVIDYIVVYNNNNNIALAFPVQSANTLYDKRTSLCYICIVQGVQYNLDPFQKDMTLILFSGNFSLTFIIKMNGKKNFLDTRITF